LLDGFRLVVDGARVDLITSAQRLLAFLALRGPLARVAVAGTLWADVPDDHALGSLRTTIWRCNRIVHGLVAVERGQLALADLVHVDVTELASTLWGLDHRAHDRVSCLGSRGELLPGWYDDWVTFERERLRHLRLHGLETAAREYAARGHYAASLECALEAVRCEPLRESAHRAVILVHLAENNVAEALREYERFRQLLLDQLGIEPSEQLANLVLRTVEGLRRSAAEGGRPREGWTVVTKSLGADDACPIPCRHAVPAVGESRCRPTDRTLRDRGDGHRQATDRRPG